MLHGLVESIIRTILDTDSLVLKQSTFIDGRLVDRVLEAYIRNKEAMKQRKGCRLGYMGHIVRLCGAIAYVLDRDMKLKQQLLQEKVKEWDNFVAGDLHQDNEAHNAVLAGGAPSFPQETEEQQQQQQQQQAAYNSQYASESSRTGVTQNPPTDEEDIDPFDGDDAFNSSATYGLPSREDEEWNHDSSGVQFQTDWPDLYQNREAGGEEHSDSSDDEPAPSFAQTEHPSAGSSDDDDDDAFNPRIGKKKKSKAVSAGSTSTPESSGGSKEENKAPTDSSSQSSASSTSSSSSGPASTLTPPLHPPRTTGMADEWAAFED